MAGTALLFRDDAYLTECQAIVVALDTEKNGVILDRTVFYAQGGGQPGDTGMLRLPSGSEVKVTNAVYGSDRSQILHLLDGKLPAIGASIQLILDWQTRYLRMRAHTALHLLSVVLPYPVTGGAIGDGQGRLDFDIAEGGLDKDEIATQMNKLIATDAAVSERWITDEELDANPGLVKTMSVQPPRGTGSIRLVEIDGIDLQPCGGTHVRRIGEIGSISVTNIEKKGKLNRRVKIAVS